MLMRYAEKKEIRLYHQQYDGLKPIGGYTLPTLDYISRHEDTKIRVLDITDVEHSMRFNPIQYRYLPTLNKCLAMAENLLRAAYEENGKQMGSVFIRRQAANILAASLWVVINDQLTEEMIKQEKAAPISALPNLLRFLSYDYDSIFIILRNHFEVRHLVQTCENFYMWKMMDQLESVFAYVRTPLMQLNTPEICWITRQGEDDFSLEYDKENIYLAIVGSTSLPHVNRLFATLVTDSLDKCRPEKDASSRTLERIEFFKPYGFDNERVREKQLKDNVKAIAEETDDWIKQSIYPRA